MKFTPTKETFIASAKTANLITVSTELTMDLDTPVSIYYKLVGDKKGYIMESVDTTQQQFGRYSFIGGEPFVRVQVFADKLLINENGLMKSIAGAPYETMKTYAARFIPADAAGRESLPLVHGGLAGYFSYETAATFDRVRGVELDSEQLLGQFMMCRYLVVYDALRNSAQLHYLADIKEGDDPSELYDMIAERLTAMRTRLSAPFPVPAAAATKRKTRVDFMARYGKAPADFLNVIQRVKEHIYAGDIFQAVPSFRFREKITRPAFLFYRRLRQVNPSPYMFYYNFGTVKLVGASPEMLIKVSGGTVYTYPIAGTRKRGKTDEEDAALAADLRADAKECAEHAMLVDLARNDLGRISVPGTVRVPKLMAVERFSHVSHMVSSVVGAIDPAYAPMDVLRATFPAGTVSGAPKLRAMEIIHELEPEPRGFYAGTVGYMDFRGNMDMCITLRTMCIENDDTAIIQSGAGIVKDSVPEKEYLEILQKAKALFEVVEEVENDVAFA